MTTSPSLSFYRHGFIGVPHLSPDEHTEGKTRTFLFQNDIQPSDFPVTCRPRALHLPRPHTHSSRPFLGHFTANSPRSLHRSVGHHQPNLTEPGTRQRLKTTHHQHPRHASVVCCWSTRSSVCAKLFVSPGETEQVGRKEPQIISASSAPALRPKNSTES